MALCMGYYHGYSNSIPIIHQEDYYRCNSENSVQNVIFTGITDSLYKRCCYTKGARDGCGNFDKLKSPKA